MSTRRGTRYRTKLCRNFALGHCPQGAQCKYLHTTAEMASTSMAAPQLQYPTYPPQSDRSSQYSQSLTMSPPAMQWGVGSPPTHTAEMPPYSWGYSSVPYNPALQAPRTAQVQYRPLSWRTTLCRHFAKNRGWCPLGDDCNYIHDLALADIALEDVRFSKNDMGESPTSKDIARRGRAGTKHSHCWAYVQGLCHVKDCPYLHPVALHLFVRHTPCLAWPNCEKGALCSFKHPEPLVPQPSGAAAPAGSPTYAYPPSPPAAPFPAAYPAYGVHYYSYQPRPPISPTQPEPRAAWAHPYDGWTPAYAAVAPSMTYGQISSGSQDARDRLIYEAGPPPLAASYFVPAYASPPWAGVLPSAVPRVIPRAPTPGSSADAQAPSEMSAPPPTAPHEFPYVPPKNQRAGHARRVSVALKSKEDSDALGLLSASSDGPRESWKTHWAHRSWAPSSSSVQAPSTPTLIY